MLPGHEHGADREQVPRAQGLREHGRECLPHEVDGVDHALVVAGGGRRALGLEHAALLADYAQRGEDAVVNRQLRANDGHEDDLDARVGRRCARVHAARDLGVGAGEVGQELVVRDGDLDLEVDGAAVAVVVHVLVHLPAAFRHLGQTLARHQLALGDEPLHGALDDLDAVLLAQLVYPLLARAQGGYLPPHVALGDLRIAHVAAHDVPDRLHQLAAVN